MYPFPSFPGSRSNSSELYDTRFSSGFQGRLRKSPIRPLITSGTNLLSAKRSGVFSHSGFFRAGLACVFERRKLSTTERPLKGAALAASGNSSTNLPKGPDSALVTQSPERCASVWAPEGLLMLQAAMETKNNTDKGWQLTIQHHHSRSLPARCLFLQPG